MHIKKQLLTKKQLKIFVLYLFKYVKPIYDNTMCGKK